MKKLLLPFLIIFLFGLAQESFAYAPDPPYPTPYILNTPIQITYSRFMTTRSDTSNTSIKTDYAVYASEDYRLPFVYGTSYNVGSSNANIRMIFNPGMAGSIKIFSRTVTNGTPGNWNEQSISDGYSITFAFQNSDQCAANEEFLKTNSLLIWSKGDVSSTFSSYYDGVVAWDKYCNISSANISPGEILFDADGATWEQGKTPVDTGSTIGNILASVFIPDKDFLIANIETSRDLYVNAFPFAYVAKAAEIFGAQSVSTQEDTIVTASIPVYGSTDTVEFNTFDTSFPLIHNFLTTMRTMMSSFIYLGFLLYVYNRITFMGTDG